MVMGEDVKKYTNGEVTVVWKSHLCIHSRKCFTGLPEVFDPRKRPWIEMMGADSARIEEQVKRCPSGALSCYYNGANEPEKVIEDGVKVEVVAGGPLLVTGDVYIVHKSGLKESRADITAFCRCGASSNKPFCDGSHERIGFEKPDNIE